jgi:hypothetical protein
LRARAALLAAALALSLSAPALAAECAGDECQGPPPAPEEVTPGTAVVEGPENPPARFPAQGGKKRQKHHGRHHRGRPRHGGGR